MTAAFCALCTSERGPFVQRPLGRGNALVAVCGECDHTHPRSGRYSFEGGETPPECGTSIAPRDGNLRTSRRG
jgi:hypothetical protein